MSDAIYTQETESAGAYMFKKGYKESGIKCPGCGSIQTTVKDSRTRADHMHIRRRRQCNDCKIRFTTIEQHIDEEFSDSHIIKIEGSIKEYVTQMQQSLLLINKDAEKLKNNIIKIFKG